ncbi:hypothetical protein YPPY11_2055, partial [Yersinia pestis PY-11]
MKIAPEPNK